MDSTAPNPRTYVATFLVSAALIVLQVSFTRLIAYKLFYHFVFLAVSLALLGLGAAGSFVAVRKAPTSVAGRARLWLLVLACSIPVVFLLLANPLPIAGHRTGSVKLMGPAAMLYLLWVSPLMVSLNFCGGVVLTSFFSRYSASMGRLYAADLAGAGIGCLLSVGLMKWGSPPLAFVAAAILVAGALLPFGWGARKRAIVATLAWLLVMAFALAGPSRFRDFQNPLAPRITKYEWNHLFRTDDFNGTYVLDGDAATYRAPWNDAARAAAVTEPAYRLAPANPSVAIIGVGGGLQLAEARRAHANRILAVDINPTILRWDLETDRAFNHDLFHDPSIEVRLGEGRNVIRSAGRSFDLIVMHAIDTYSATASGAYALSENFLYTKEAIQDYFRALSPQGILSVSRWLFYPPRENLRLFVTSLDALAELGVAEPRDHIVVIAPVPDYTTLGDARVFGYLLVSRSPLNPGDVARLDRHVQAMGWSLLYAPHVRTGTAFDQFAWSADRSALTASYPYLISTVTDSSPYLFQFYNPLQRASFAGGDWGTQNVYQSSAVTLVAALGLALVLGGLTILGPLLWARWRSPSAGKAVLSLAEVVFFAGLGVGFMALEVPLIQVLSLYLGHPIYGFTVVLVALLVSAAIGSSMVERMQARIPVICATVSVLLLLVAAGIFPLVHATIDLSGALRVVVSLLVVVACGIPMGFPLALGVRALGRAQTASVSWAWGVNGVASVVGACLVMILMVFVGSRAALGVGALSYAVSALASRSLR